MMVIVSRNGDTVTRARPVSFYFLPLIPTVHTRGTTSKGCDFPSSGPATPPMKSQSLRGCHYDCAASLASRNSWWWHPRPLPRRWWPPGRSDLRCLVVSATPQGRAGESRAAGGRCASATGQVWPACPQPRAAACWGDGFATAASPGRPSSAVRPWAGACRQSVGGVVLRAWRALMS